MALKRQNTMMAAFSMASMTDVIFLLLIFFMVTSTFVFPTALEVNVPEAVYADEEVTYGTLVKVLDLGAQNNLKMVLATKPAPTSARPAAN